MTSLCARKLEPISLAVTPALAIVLGLIVATPAPAFMVPASMDRAAGSGVSQWKEYARQQLMPAFGWRGAEVAKAPSVLDATRAAFVQQTSNGVFADLGSHPRLRMSFNDDAGVAAVATRSNSLFGSASPLHADVSQATWMHPLGRGRDLGLTAIVANQRFATQGFGTFPWDALSQVTPSSAAGLAETADGSGVRLSLDQRVDDDFVANLTLQSRIEMDAFKAFRGVNSEPGDFDIPGFVRTAMQLNVAADALLSFDLQRVFYSEVSTFSSALLPTRFLSLLGDGGSPEFAWRDLTVFGVEAKLGDGERGQWSLRYSTQQQPRPTSRLLDRALSERYSDDNVAFGYRREFGAQGALQLAAAYSPVSYFFGAIPYAQRELDGGRHVEFEARWSVPF